jgi:predicted SprT family Zn-dependent metalloprotease
LNTRKDYINWWKESSEYIKENHPDYIQYLQDYRLNFNNNKRSFGVCYYGKVKKIELSEFLCKKMAEKEVKDTILHEMAHAIDAGIRGYSNHDQTWKGIASDVGATPKSSSKISKGIECKYVCVVKKTDESYIFQYGLNRKQKNIVLNKVIKNIWIRGKKATTINKLMFINWDDWIYYCEVNDLSPFAEDWINKI